MASIVTYSGGLKRIDFTLEPGGPRRTLRLGRIPQAVCRVWSGNLEKIIADKLAQRPHDAELSKWLGDLDESMIRRMRAVGLVDGVGLSRTTLAEFLKQCLATFSGKPGTKKFYEKVQGNLTNHFGGGRFMQDIHPFDADAWHAWLEQDQGLSRATVSRRLVGARTLFRKAVRWRIIQANPFDGIRAGSQTDEKRQQFIPGDVIHQIIDHTPDPYWKVIISLARFGGMRCPSEHFALRWRDIDWERGVMRVTSCKTERMAGHGHRFTPLFPEVRRHLIDLFEHVPEGEEYVIAAKYRQGAMNLRTQFNRLIERAGLIPWPKLWQNLRASRETELMREYDLATVCKWLGNSPTVAARHYAMSVDFDADVKRAAEWDEAKYQAQHNAHHATTRSSNQECSEPKANAAKSTENGTIADSSQLLLSADNTGEWARQDSNL